MSVKALSWAWDQEVSDALAKLVLLAIADPADENGLAWPKIKRLVTKTGLHRSTVISKINWLETEGYLTKQHRFTEAGRQTTSYLQLQMTQTELPLEKGRVAQSDTGVAENDPPPNRGRPERRGGSPRATDGGRGERPSGVGLERPLELSEELSNELPDEEKRASAPSTPTAEEQFNHEGREKLIAWSGVDPSVLSAIPAGSPGWEGRLLAYVHPETATSAQVHRLWRSIPEAERPGVLCSALVEYADPNDGLPQKYRAGYFVGFLERAVEKHHKPAPQVRGLSPAAERRMEEERRANMRPCDAPTRVAVPENLRMAAREKQVGDAEAWLGTLSPERQRSIETEIAESAKAQFGKTEGGRFVVFRQDEVIRLHALRPRPASGEQRNDLQAVS